MTSYTPAADFLSEVDEINGFIDDIMSCPRNSHWHWPSFYLLYVDVDRLAMTLTRTEHFLGPPLLPWSNALALDQFVEAGNAILGALGARQKAIVPWLYPMSRRIDGGAGDASPGARLVAHVHPKSGWYQEFFARYEAGKLAADGATLARTVLPILAEPPYERIDQGSAGCMLRHQVFDISTPEARLALADASRQAATRLGKVAAGMQACLRAHCRIEDLLYPCSA